MSEWQPIETAPRDGTKVLLIVVGYEPAVGAYYERGWDYQEEGDFVQEAHYTEWCETTGPWEPTHWMPLPAPPKEADNV